MKAVQSSSEQLFSFNVSTSSIQKFTPKIQNLKHDGLLKKKEIYKSPLSKQYPSIPQSSKLTYPQHHTHIQKICQKQKTKHIIKYLNHQGATVPEHSNVLAGVLIVTNSSADDG
eukprot:TRINITY_DN8596_c0_g1_i5.p2 TRINITY_DN8596_c0_g1~~TRINITY_DN8596_c0_g1_i5.p2  ORF type:complete len:127 (+),score=15.09 TRINITY_DN8596_c0_g1_i5:40-381(+)